MPLPPILPEASEPLTSGAGARRSLEGVLAARAPRLSARERARVVRALEDFGRDGVDPLLVLSIIAHESGFDPAAIGPSGSVGLMQLQPRVAREVARRHGLRWQGEHMLLDPVANVWLGSVYLRDMLARYGDDHLALAAYNIGPARLQRMLDRGKRPQRLYSARVLAHYERLEALAFRDSLQDSLQY